MSVSNDCGCCSDTAPTPQPFNPPGQSLLAYRIADYSGFMQRMIGRISRQRIDGNAPLANLTTRAADDFALGILDGWATVADLLTFYQERIVNEGFLRTATERLSLQQLARTIGYELQPGVAAAVALAFTVDASGSTPAAAPIPLGTQVQSIPQQEGELPQTFETSVPFTAQAGWNTLRPQLSQSQTVQRATTELYIKGTSSNLKAGDRLLLLGAAQENDWAANAWDVRRVLRVASEAKKERTRVEVTAGLRQTPADFTLYALRQRAAIFGHNAPDWNGLSAQVRSDYLGLAGPDLLPQADTGDWPDYTICAPGTSPAPRDSFSRAVEVTAQQVADAANAAATSQASALSGSAMAAAPATVLAAGQGIATVARTITAAGVGEAATWRNALSGNLNETPFYKIVDNLSGIATDLIGSVGLQPPDVNWPDLSESDNFFDAIADLVTSLNTRLNNLVDDINSGVTSLQVDLPNLSTRLNAIANGFDQLRRAHPLLLPFNILENLQEALSDSFLQASRAADATAAAGAAGSIAQLLQGVLQTALELDRSPDEVAAIARFTVKTARFAAMLAAPQTLFADIDLSQTADHLLGSMMLDQHADHLPLALRNISDEEERLALTTALGVAATGAVGAAAASGGVVPAAAVAALGAGLIPLVLLGPSVHQGAEQIAGSVERAVTRALNPPDETIVSRRPVFAADGCKVDLDNRYDKIGGDSWAYFETSNQQALFRVTAVNDGSRAQFLLSGETTRLTLAGGSLDKFETKVRQTKVYAAPDKLELAAVDVKAKLSGNQLELETVADPPLPAGAQLIFSGETSAGEPHAELVSVATATVHDNRTRLRLVSKLGATYRRDSVVIYGNVVSATHGETVNNERLGSGDGAIAHQRFTLKRSPLTHVAAATAGGSRPELTVRVNDVAWQQVDSLYQAAADAEFFQLQINNDGSATILFGDGTHGRRLPTGRGQFAVENISASYRNGIGQVGEVGAGALTLLKTRPFGIQQVTNPLAADGAEDPESIDNARRNAPLTTRTLDRIVSLQDYEDFARAFAGVGKAQAVPIWDGRQEMVHVTVTDPTGAPVAATTLTALQEAVAAARDPLRTVCFAGGAVQQFRLRATVIVDPAYLHEDVDRQLHAALQAAFAFDQRQFGQPVSLAELMALMHTVAGVIAVDVDQLYKSGEAALLHNVLGASVATFDRTLTDRTACGRIRPAELLVVAADGVTLTEVSP